jgi:hypothetical protein
MKPPAHTPISPRSIAAIALLSFALGGCSSDSDSNPMNAQDPPGYTDPTALLNAHAAALEEQDYAKYEKLLTEDFEYFPQAEDLTDFPWLQGQISWARADELQMIVHMFDDAFQPADASAGTVNTIHAALTVTSQQSQPDGSLLVDARADMTVMYLSCNVTHCDVRFEFRLVAGSDGFLRIRSIRELPPYQRAVEPESWARTKSLYR